MIIARAKAKPGELKIGSVGIGSAHHLIAEMLKSAAGIELTHVPYRGEAPAIPDLVAGRIDLMFLTTAKPLIDEGRVVGLGHTGDGPWFQLPQLKPLTALGLKDFVVPGWNGLMAPKGTPPAVVAKLSDALASALHSDAAVQSLQRHGFHPRRGHARTDDQADRRGHADLHHRDPRAKPEVRQLAPNGDHGMKVRLFAASIGLSVLMTQAAAAAEITAFVTGAARSAYETLAPQFERATGHKLVSQFELPPTLIKKIDAGEPFDVIILSYDVEGLIKQGKVVADSRAVLGRVGVGVAVRQGAPKPDFSTVDAFKRSLLDAKTHRDIGRGEQRTLRRLADRAARNRRTGQAEDPFGPCRGLGGNGFARRGGLCGVGASAADRHSEHRVAWLSA